MEEQMRDYQIQVDHLNGERANLLAQLQTMASSHVQAVDTDQQPDESQQEKLVKVNTKLKRAVQSLKEKIHRVVVERSDLFENVGDETSERLDHLISTVKAQALKIDLFETDRQQTEERHRDEMHELKRLGLTFRRSHLTLASLLLAHWKILDETSAKRLCPLPFRRSTVNPSSVCARFQLNRPLIRTTTDGMTGSRQHRKLRTITSNVEASMSNATFSKKVKEAL